VTRDGTSELLATMGQFVTSLEPDHDPRWVPKAVPYIFPPVMVEELWAGIGANLNIMLTGPTGCGKTSLPMQVAAAIDHPCVRFNLDGETRVSHLRGQQRPVAQDGALTLEFRMGLLVQAMRSGWWVVLDELDAATPAVLFVLQSVLEEGRRELQIPETGEAVAAHPAFRVFATSNTIGSRAHFRARHAGTNVMNTALVDRFAMIIEVGYPDEEEELARIRVQVPELFALPHGDLMAEGIAKVAAALRFDTRFRSDFSTRRCIQWARLVARFPIENNQATRDLPFDVQRAAHLAVLRKLESPTDTKVAREVIYRQFDYPETDGRS
jgi:cobaltochelatase CobS